jgi:hypothetical protein
VLALGMGLLVICGCSSPEVLDQILNGPELAWPFSSVCAAFAKGIAVHLYPPEQLGAPDLAKIEHRGRVVLAASAHVDLYFLDEQLHAEAAARSLLDHRYDRGGPLCKCVPVAL